MLHYYSQVLDSRILLVEEILGAQSNNNTNNNNYNNYNDMDYLYSQSIPLNSYLKPPDTYNKAETTKKAGASSKTITKKHKSRKCGQSSSNAYKSIKDKPKTTQCTRKRSTHHKNNHIVNSVLTLTLTVQTPLSI